MDGFIPIESRPEVQDVMATGAWEIAVALLADDAPAHRTPPCSP